MLRVILLIFFFTLPNTLIASSKPIAKALMVKGQVTYLPPHTKESTILRAGQPILEDASIVTGEKSLAKIQYINGGTLVLKPNGKIIIRSKTYNKEKVSFLGLLKGQVRSHIRENKESQKKIKMFIKTRSAAIGVRGTEFHTVYIPESKRTGVLTYEGEVEVYQTDKKVLEIEKIQQAPSTKVKAGKFTSLTDKTVTRPEAINISSDQFEVLKKADSISNPSPKDLFGSVPKTKVDPWGLVDLSSATYVPPKKVTIESGKAIRAEKQFGTFDKVSGNYLPPKGIELDPVKGFIVDERADEKDKKELQEKADEINEKLKQQDDKANEIDEKLKPVNEKTSKKKPHKIKKDDFPYSLGVELISKQIKVENKSSYNVSTSGEIHSNFGLGVYGKYRYSLHKKFQLNGNLGVQILDFDPPSYSPHIKGEDKFFFNLGVGGELFVHENHSAGLEFKWQEDLVYSAQYIEGTLHTEFRNEFIPEFKFSWDAIVGKWKENKIHVVPGFHFLPKDNELENGSGYSLGLWSQNIIRNFKKHKAKLYFKHVKQETRTIKHNRTTLGVEFEYYF